MSKAVRNIVLATALVAATGLAFAARQGMTGPLQNPLSVAAIADSSRTEAFMGTVQFKVTNNSNEIVRVPYWQLPNVADEGKVFQVYRDGKPAEYIGKLVKRPPPTEADLVTFQPHETKVMSVDLSKAYDLRASGTYSVQFGTYLHGARTANGRALADASGRMAALKSAPLSLWVDARNPLNSLKEADRGKPGGGGGTQVVNGVSYVGCTTTRINGAGAAVVSARGYTENAKGYLAGGTVGARYTTWFGAYTSSRYNTVASNFVKIDQAMDQSGGQIKINCGCSQNYYAYVYPTQPYQIWVCKAFWSAPQTGTDSKAGTLVHEMSHFNVVAGTDDHVYGQSGAKSLAISDPAKAVDNADSHEYFAENTPSQN